MKKLLLSLLAFLFLTGCAPQDKTQTAYYFDTVISLTLPAKSSDALFTQVWDLCAKYDRLWDRFSTDSDLQKLTPETPVKVHPETATLLQTALDLSLQTEGAFDARLGGISDLWQGDTLPDADTLSKAVKAANETTFIITENTITQKGTGKVDFGGIAKGYVTDRLADLLREKGCPWAILNLGGNVYCLGSKDDQPFSVGIDPLMEQENPPILAVRDGAAVTAGTTLRYHEIEGERYHHILHPHTGTPAQSGVTSATVTAKTATLADALSTACVVLGPKKAEELLKSFPDVSAVLVLDDGSVTPLQNPKFVQNL